MRTDRSRAPCRPAGRAARPNPRAASPRRTAPTGGCRAAQARWSPRRARRRARGGRAASDRDRRRSAVLRSLVRGTPPGGSRRRNPDRAYDAWPCSSSCGTRTPSPSRSPATAPRPATTSSTSSATPTAAASSATDELARWEPEEPLADSARALLHVRELARRAVSEGLVFPQVAEIGGDWFAFWGATLETQIEQTLTRIAAASPPVIADYFHGDRVATVNDLYPRLVDRIARDRLVAAGVRTRVGAAVRPQPRGRGVSPRPQLGRARTCRTAAPTARSRRRSRAGSTRASQRLDPRAVGRRPPPRRARRRQPRARAVAARLRRRDRRAARVAPLGRRPRRVPLPSRHRSVRRPAARVRAAAPDRSREHGFTFDENEPREAPLDADGCRVLPAPRHADAARARSCCRPRGRHSRRASAPT